MRSQSGASTRRSSGQSFRLLFIGISLVLYSTPLAVLLVRSLPDRLVQDVFGIPVPTLAVDIQFFPSLTAEFDLTAWLGGLLSDLVFLGLSLLSAVAMLGTILGVLFVLIFGGFLSFKDPRDTLGAVVTIFQSRFSRGVLAVYLLTGAALFIPRVLLILTELFILLIVGGSILVVLGVAWVQLRETQQTGMQIGVVYPIGVGMLCLPLIATAFASPTFGPWIRESTLAGAVFLLDTVLAVGGLNEWLRSTFELEGPSYLGAWIGVIVVAGWIVGLVVEGHRSWSG